MKTTLNNKKTKTLFLTIGAALFFSAALTSCSKDKDNASLSASVMVTNSAQGSQPQDFYLDNKMSASAVAYGTSSGYISANISDNQAAFKNSGSAAVNSSFSLSLAAGQYYDVFYNDDNTSTTIQDNRTAPSSGKARIRFINLSSSLQSDVDFGISGGAKIVSNIGYKAASAYYDVDPASVFALYLSGSSSALLSIPAVIQAGHIYTIYVSGTSSSSIAFHTVNEN
jgi:uncharacterized protein DUF4397